MTRGIILGLRQNKGNPQGSNPATQTAPPPPRGPAALQVATALPQPARRQGMGQQPSAQLQVLVLASFCYGWLPFPVSLATRPAVQTAPRLLQRQGSSNHQANTIKATLCTAESTSAPRVV